MPAPLNVVNEARKAAKAANAPGDMFKPSCRLAIAFSEAAMVLMPAAAERFAPSAAARLAIMASCAEALAQALAEALAEALADAIAETESAAERLAAAPGASRFTPSVALTEARAARRADNAGRPGTLGTGALPRDNAFIRLTIADNWAEAPGAARLMPRVARTC